MIEPVAIRIAEAIESGEAAPSKRFGLYTIGEDGLPGKLVGYYDRPDEIISYCAGYFDAYVVEVGHYAFIKTSDFRILFGPLQQAGSTNSSTKDNDYVCVKDCPIIS